MTISPITIVLLINTVALTLLAAYFVSRETKESRIFALLMLAAALWAMASALENNALTMSEKIIWSKISYLGIVSVSPLWLIFSASYSGYKGKLKNLMWYIWLLPIITLIFVATNGSHGLIWSEIKVTTDIYGDHLIYKHGAAFYFTLCYSYVFLVTGIIVLINHLKKASKIQRHQSTIIILGMSVPWLANLVYVLISPGFLTGVDFTPVALAITGITVMISIFKYEFLTIIPIAKDLVYQNIEIGIIITNNNEQIVDSNISSKAILGSQIQSKAGLELIMLAKDFSLAKAMTSGKRNHYLEKTNKWINIKVNNLKDNKNKNIGKIILIQDITEQKKIENHLKESRHFFSDVTDFLPDPTFVLNTKGEVVIWNKAMEKLTGVMTKDIIGKGNYEPSLAYYGERRPMLADLVLNDNPLSLDWKLYSNYELARDGRTVSTKSYNKYLNKNGVYLLIVAKPLLDSQGKIIYAIESTRDISDLEKHNEKMGEKLNELSKLNEIMVNREIKMIELKQEIAKLKEKNK